MSQQAPLEGVPRDVPESASQAASQLPAQAEPAS
jgi:hypothetical protein